VAEELLRLEGVTAGYGRRLALRAVDLSVGAGEVVGLIGPNGSGKTTLVRVASRTLRPSAGSVRVAGRDPYEVPARAAARLVAVVPQEVAPAFDYSVLEVILMGREAYATSWRRSGAQDLVRAREAAETARVHHLTDRPLDGLSGGERQRVLLAQALAQDAPLMLLDEPTTHLDIRHVVGILDAVRGLAHRGRAILAIFHDLNLAAAYCDRIVALSDGRVVSEGRPGAVITPDLLREVYGVDAEVRPHDLTGRPWVSVRPPPSPPRTAVLPRAHVVGGAGRGAAAMRALAEAGFEVTAGVLHATDTDAMVAERLNLERIVVPPFSEVDPDAREKVQDLMAAASFVVVCDAPYGPGNVGNLRAVLAVAGRSTEVVLVKGTPIGERDFTGGEASDLWERIAARGRVVARIEDLPAAMGY